MKTEDYLTLPDFIENIVPVVLDPAASKAYTKLEREMLLQVDTETITAGTAAVLNGKRCSFAAAPCTATKARLFRYITASWTLSWN